MALGCQLAVLFVRHFNVCPFSRNCNTTAIKLQDTHAHTHTISATAHRYTFTYRYIRPWKRKVYALVCYNFDCFHCSSRISSSNNDCISLPRPLATHTYPHTQTQKQKQTHTHIYGFQRLSVPRTIVHHSAAIFVLLMCIAAIAAKFDAATATANATGTATHIK